MSFSVAFLGHHYELPDEILDYLEYERVTSRIMGSVLDLMIDKVEECKLGDAHSLVEELRKTRKPYQRLMISTAEEYVKELIAKGIFDISSIELLERTDGFEKLDNLADDALDKHLEEAKRIFSDQLDDMQRAYSSAESSITGSGVSVYTSSALTLMASGVFETGVLRSQAKKADREFSEACASIEARANSAEARNDAHTIFGIFLPALSELMLDLCNQLFSVFLTELATRGLFDFDSIKGYNLRKAEKMLGNIRLVSDPEELLNQAFAMCPYCREIYKRAFSLGMMDEETFGTAETFGFSGVLIDELEGYCRQNVGKPEVFNRYLAILLKHRDTSRSDTILKMFKDDVAKAKAGYRELQCLFTEDRDARDASIEKMLSNYDELNRASKLLLMGGAEVRRVIAPDIKSIIKIPIGECLVREGLADGLCMPGYKDGQTFEQLYKSLVRNIAQSILDYGERLRIHVDSCLDVSESISSEIANRNALIIDRRLKVNDAIERLGSLKARLRLRDIDLKAEIDSQDGALRRELASLIARCKIETLEKLKADVVREGDCILSCYLCNSEVSAMGGAHFVVMDSSVLDGLLDTDEIENAVECRLNPKPQFQDSGRSECVGTSGGEEAGGTLRDSKGKRKKHLLVALSVLSGVMLLAIGYSSCSQPESTETPYDGANIQESKLSEEIGVSLCSMHDLKSFFADLDPYLDYLGIEVVNREVDMPPGLVYDATSVELGDLTGEVSHMVTDPTRVDGEDIIEALGICQWKSYDNVSRDEYKEIVSLLCEHFDSAGQREFGVETDVGVVSIAFWEDTAEHTQVTVFLDEDERLYFRWVLSEVGGDDGQGETGADPSAGDGGTDEEEGGSVPDGGMGVDETNPAQDGTGGSTGYGGAGRPGEW